MCACVVRSLVCSRLFFGEQGVVVMVMVVVVCVCVCVGGGGQYGIVIMCVLVKLGAVSLPSQMSQARCG